MQANLTSSPPPPSLLLFVVSTCCESFLSFFTECRIVEGFFTDSYFDHEEFYGSTNGKAHRDEDAHSTPVQLGTHWVICTYSVLLLCLLISVTICSLIFFI